MSKQIDEAIASGTHKYVSRKLHAKLYQVTNLLLVALRPAQTRQVKTGCPCPPLEAPPGTWYTMGPHFGSPPNWNTYRGLGSARTTMWICVRAETAGDDDEPRQRSRRRRRLRRRSSRTGTVPKMSGEGNGEWRKNPTPARGHLRQRKVGMLV